MSPVRSGSVSIPALSPAGPLPAQPVTGCPPSSSPHPYSFFPTPPFFLPLFPSPSPLLPSFLLPMLPLFSPFSSSFLLYLFPLFFSSSICLFLHFLDSRFPRRPGGSTLREPSLESLLGQCWILQTSQTERSQYTGVLGISSSSC